MTWVEKLKLTVDRRHDWRELRIMFHSAKMGAPAEHISTLRKSFAFLPESYLNLISIHDGLDIDGFVFLGSGNSDYPSVEKVRARWLERFGLLSSLPFAEDAGGNPLFLHPDGSIEIYWVDTAGHETRFMCSSFDELMEQGFFGPRHTQILEGRDWIPADDEGWVSYLKKSGWY